MVFCLVTAAPVPPTANVTPASFAHLLSSTSSISSGWIPGCVPVPVRRSSPPIFPTISMTIDDKTPADTVVSSRRQAALGILASGAALGNLSVVVENARAVSSSRRALRSEQVPESEYQTLPSGLKYYDIKVGSGDAAIKGSRVAIHYVAKWKGITFMTSRQGMGVTGGTPYGFDVGASELGMVLKGLDLGVLGMRVGGQRMLIVPPELAYGNRGIQEIPPGATLEFNVELLSIKQDAFGSRVRVVEG